MTNILMEMLLEITQQGCEPNSVNVSTGICISALIFPRVHGMSYTEYLLGH